MKVYKCIVVGAGASGLFYTAGDDLQRQGKAQQINPQLNNTAINKTHSEGDKLILEKTARPGQKLLMSGNGQCNLTHDGSIKDFVGKYGEKGKRIRGCLFKHSNMELTSWMESIGVPLTTRDDGKVFPKSMKARDVLDALLTRIKENGWTLRCNAEVTSISIVPAEHASEHDDSEQAQVVLRLSDGTAVATSKLVIATGGASYPATGSDGTFFDILNRDLGLQITELKPALAPVYVQDFSYSALAGISFDNVEVRCNGHVTKGPMLITHKGFSGPAILHSSQYAKAGDLLKINYLPAQTADEIYQKMKTDQPGNKTGLANYISSAFSLPKAFANELLADPQRKLNTMSHKELEHTARQITESTYSISGTGGWKDAMVTAGGVSLDQIDLKTMSVKPEALSSRLGEIPPHTAPNIRIVGEALDINGETGGYNLQFAYSSAMAALT